MLLSIAACAFLGGCVRAALGIRKYKLRKGQGASILASGLVGIVCGLAFLYVTSLNSNAALWAAGLAGYAGSDVIESLHKIHMKRGAVWV
ncbi:MAG: hypothetical protein QXL81_02820 [Candidatus Aenigmatarchaeota archaeon]